MTSVTYWYGIESKRWQYQWKWRDNDNDSNEKPSNAINQYYYWRKIIVWLLFIIVLINDVWTAKPNWQYSMTFYQCGDDQWRLLWYWRVTSIIIDVLANDKRDVMANDIDQVMRKRLLTGGVAIDGGIDSSEHLTLMMTIDMTVGKWLIRHPLIQYWPKWRPSTYQ